MNIDVSAYRSSFNIAVVSADASLSHRFITVLSVEGYKLKPFVSLDQLEATGKDFPPHIMLLDFRAIGQAQNLQRLAQRFPETHVYILGVTDDLDQIANNLKTFRGIIPQGRITGRVLTALIDGSIASLLMEYELEKRQNQPAVTGSNLMEKEDNHIIDINDVYGIGPDKNLERFVEWVDRLAAVQHYDEAIKSFVNELYDYYECSSVIYFKYLPAYASLVATHSEGIPFQKIRGLGLNFAEDKDFDSAKDLSRIDAHRAFIKMIQSFTDEKQMAVSTLVLDGQARGLFVFLGASPSILREPYYKACEKVLIRWLSEVLLREKVFNLERQDELTGCLNKRTFSDNVFLEVSRARRILLPVAYVYVSIDNMQKIKNDLNPDRYKTLLKMVAKVIEQSVRKTDSVGRMAENEFAILFPHMTLANLNVKVARLKRLLESARYFNDLKKDFEISTTICISEYPSTAYDAEDLMLSAAQKVVTEENTSQIFAISKGPSFVPDFEVK